MDSMDVWEDTPAGVCLLGGEGQNKRWVISKHIKVTSEAFNTLGNDHCWQFLYESIVTSPAVDPDEDASVGRFNPLAYLSLHNSDKSDAQRTKSGK